MSDARVTIPCPGDVESLNAAVAGSLLLYEASRQRAECMKENRQPQQRNTGVLRCAQDDGKNKQQQLQQQQTATTTAGLPFDFAQGRLFGDDNHKGNRKNNHRSKTDRETR